MIKITDYKVNQKMKLDFVHVWLMGEKLFDWYKPSIFPLYQFVYSSSIRRQCICWNEL